MTQHAVVKKRRFRLFSYIGETISELKKVVWLTRREIAYLTALVIVVTVVMGIILGALDFGFSELVDKLFLAGR